MFECECVQMCASVCECARGCANVFDINNALLDKKAKREYIKIFTTYERYPVMPFKLIEASDENYSQWRK